MYTHKKFYRQVIYQDKNKCIEVLEKAKLSTQRDNRFYYSPDNVILSVNESMDPMIPSPHHYSFTISPALPTGLELAYDGIIQGIPKVALDTTTFTIVAKNMNDQDESAIVTITIHKFTAPLQYHPDNVVTIQNVRLMPMIPTSNYHNFIVTPSLPSGLIIEEDGVITGTPTSCMKETVFTIQAISPEGKSSSTTVSITVIAEFHYQPSTLVAKVKQPISPMIPSEKLHTYVINPALPVGLTINTSTGIIEGTPTCSYPKADYSVSALTASGRIYTTISITVEEEQLTISENNVYSLPILISIICVIVIIVMIAVFAIKSRKEEPLVSTQI